MGGYLLGKVANKAKDCLVFYAVIEIAIGIFCLFTPFLFTASKHFYLYSTIKFFLSFLVMILPTIFLGMTIPLVTKIISFRLQFLGSKVGSVLALNTTGNILGVRRAYYRIDIN
jgi:spermidine synthase